MMPWKMKNIYKPPIFGFQPLIFGDVQYHFHQVEICYWWFLSLNIVLQFHGAKTKKLYILQIWWQQRWPRFRNKKSVPLVHGGDMIGRAARVDNLQSELCVTMEEENPAVSRWWVSNIFYFHPENWGR